MDEQVPNVVTADVPAEVPAEEVTIDPAVLASAEPEKVEVVADETGED